MGLLERIDTRRSTNGQRAASQPIYQTRGPVSVVSRLDVGAPTPSSIALQAKTNPLVLGPIYQIATRIGALPIKCYRLDDEVRLEDNDHPAYQLLRRPNPMLTRNLLVSYTVACLLVHKKAAWLKVREAPGEPPFELWPLMPQQLKIKAHPSKLIESFAVTIDGRDEPLAVEDVCYFRMMIDLDNITDGMSPFDALASVGALGTSAISGSTDMFDNALLGRVWAKLTREVGTRAFNRIRMQLERVRQDKFAIPVMEENAELHELPGPSDAVLVNALSMARKIITDTLGIPEAGDDKAFVRDAVAPIADAIEQELERSLMIEWPERAAFPEFAFRDLLRGDPQARIAAHQSAILSGQESPNEARRAENRPALDGGDQLFVPLNLVPIEHTAMSGEPQPRDTQGGLGGDEGKGTLVAASAQRGLHARAKRNYGSQRERIVTRYSSALSKRLRTIFEQEAREVLGAIPARAAADEKLPSIADVRKRIGKREREVRDVLDKYLDSTAKEAGPSAAAVVDADFTDAARARLRSVFKQRAGAIADTIGERRAQSVLRVVRDSIDRGTSNRDLAEAIAARYKDMSISLADGVARSEVAWAHEQTALITWADAGVESMEVVFGGGPCTEEVCESAAQGSPYKLGEDVENIGYSFADADAPPLHPGCTCFAAPVISSEPSRSAEPRARRQQQPITVNVEPKIDVHLPEPPKIDVHMAEQHHHHKIDVQPASFDLPPAHIDVNLPASNKKRTRKVEHDDSGRIVRIVDEEAL